MTRIFYCLLITCIIVSACKKTVRHSTIDEALKSHFNYQVGSYWVYKDSLSGIEDSFYVTKNEFKSTQPTDDQIIDEIVVSIKEKQFNPMSLQDTALWVLRLNSNILSLEWLSPKLKSPTSLFGQLTWYPFKVGLILGTYNQGYVTNIFSDYSINGKSFKNVAEVNDTFANYNNYKYDDWFYLSEDNGIVKIKLNHPSDTINRVWEIERWKIYK